MAGAELVHQDECSWSAVPL